jgi:hypothetical protein
MVGPFEVVVAASFKRIRFQLQMCAIWWNLACLSSCRCVGGKLGGGGSVFIVYLLVCPLKDHGP